ncbi:MAG: glycosyltransferase family 2 protein [Bacteroidetes bacterium]|nr:glycosyltransferase family 2 protein [Bacteroidota bacterium]
MIAVSVIIPCRNEKKYIAGCIGSVLQSDFTYGEFEIIVCDGQSDDGTIEVVKKIASAHKNLICLENKYHVTPHALNLGIRNAKGEVIIILGAHAEVYHDYLARCYELLSKEKELGCTGGVLENIFEDEVSAAIAAAMSSSFGVGNAHFRTGMKEGYVDTVAFGAYKREVFQKAGFFDEELVRNQDDEFNYRVLKSGYRIKLSKEIKAKYYVRGSTGKLFRQYFQYGYWKVYVNKKHRALTTPRQLAPPAFVFFLFAGAIVSCFIFKVRLVYFAVIAIYLLTSLAAAIPVSEKFSRYFRIVFSFWILHLAYGSGYLEGAFHFFLMGKKPSAGRTGSSR